MRSLTAINNDNAELFDNVAASKQAPRNSILTAVRSTVLTAYSAYEAAAPEVGRLPSLDFSEEEKEALLHAYNSETAPLAEIRNKILKRPSFAICPFCNLSESSTLDHYLPKEFNPQFAIYSDNLVPSCASCNGRKLSRLLDHTHARMFIHPYFDVLPNLQFLGLAVHILEDALALNWRILQPEGMPAPTYRHLQSHFKELNLSTRYQTMSLDHLRELDKSLERHYMPGRNIAEVSLKLSEKAQDYELKRGINHWKTVLYRTLSTHTEFCDGGFRVLAKIQ